jgi:DNA-binding transcriptional MerR regulator
VEARLINAHDGVSIREAAARSGLSTYALRYYEREALIPPIGRTSSGHRRFGPDDLAWIDYVSCLRSLGFGIGEIRRYATLYREGDATLEERAVLLDIHAERIRSKIAELRGHLEEIEVKLERYRRPSAAVADG